jgi:hypothetical protein
MQASTQIRYWVCPQNCQDHVFDYDDPRIARHDSKLAALCPKDARPMALRFARVEHGTRAHRRKR